MTPLHLGALHPYEQALTLLLAFGPFVALGIVIWRRRREETSTAPRHPEAGSRDTAEEAVDR